MSYQAELQADLIHARHEAGHALHAHLVGHVVQRVSLGHVEGYTEVAQPITPDNLEERWAQSPLMTSLELSRVIGTLRAGSLCELAGRDISGRDVGALGVWREAYTRHIGCNADWTRLYAAVYERLSAWHRHGSVRSAVSALAEMLLRQRETSRPAWLSMVEVALVDALVPEPHYTPMFPSPAPAASPSVRRRPELRAVPTGAAKPGEELVMEDARHWYYSVDTLGDVSLFRRVDKTTRSTKFLVTRTVGEDHRGPVVKGGEYASESEARGAMVRLAG